MSQKCVELIFGRLATDEELRREFRRDPLGTLGKLAACGVELTKAERDALLATNVRALRAPRRDDRSPPPEGEPAPERGTAAPTTKGDLRDRQGSRPRSAAPRVPAAGRGASRARRARGSGRRAALARRRDGARPRAQQRHRARARVVPHRGRLDPQGRRLVRPDVPARRALPQPHGPGELAPVGRAVGRDLPFVRGLLRRGRRSARSCRPAAP